MVKNAQWLGTFQAAISGFCARANPMGLQDIINEAGKLADYAVAILTEPLPDDDALPCEICGKTATQYSPVTKEDYCDEHAPDDCEALSGMSKPIHLEACEGCGNVFKPENIGEHRTCAKCADPIGTSGWDYPDGTEPPAFKRCPWCNGRTFSIYEDGALCCQSCLGVIDTTDLEEAA